MNEPKPTFRITIEAMPGASPAINRLRMALKSLLRAFGLRCLACEDVTPAAPVTEMTGVRASDRIRAAMAVLDSALRVKDGDVEKRVAELEALVLELQHESQQSRIKT